MEKQQNQPMSFDDVSFLYVNLLRIIGLLPFQHRDYHFLGSYVLLVLFGSASVINWTMVIGYLSWKKSLTVDLVCETVMIFGMHLRYYVMLVNRSRLRAMMRECGAIWSECDDDGHRTVSAFEARVRRLLVLLIGSYSFTVVLYTGNALVHRLPALESNGTQRRMLPYKWYYENAEDHWPGYWITFFIQQIVINCTSLINAGCDTASPFLMTIMSGYFRHLADNLRASADEPEEADDSQRQYGEFVRHAKLHQRILAFSMELERFGRTIFLIQVLTTVYNISLIGIKIIGTDPDKYKYIPLLAMSFYQLLLCQWAPDMLATESSQVATAAYSSSTTWMKSQVGNLLVVVIARAQHPVQMTAGGVVNLSLEKFGSICVMMTSAASFFTVLRNFNL